MKNSKSSGSTGFSVGFLKVLWNQIGHHTVYAINHAFEVGKFPALQSQGVIMLIPKQGKGRRKIKNLRPVTLLNSLCKIASACMAEGIKPALNRIIHLDQKRFLQDRFIRDTLRNVQDAMDCV